MLSSVWLTEDQFNKISRLLPNQPMWRAARGGPSGAAWDYFMYPTRRSLVGHACRTRSSQGAEQSLQTLVAGWSCSRACLTLWRAKRLIFRPS